MKNQTIKQTFCFHRDKGRSLSILLLFFLYPVFCESQSTQETIISITELLQYQRQKQDGKRPNSMFKHYGFKHIRATKILGEDNSRHIWGYHVNANLDYDKNSQPLYRLFRKADYGSMVIIDHQSDGDNYCELIFWGKQYYRRYATQLRRIGFKLRRHPDQSNVLEFRKEDATVGVDITIWPEVYLVEIRRADL